MPNPTTIAMNEEPKLKHGTYQSTTDRRMFNTYQDGRLIDSYMHLVHIIPDEKHYEDDSEVKAKDLPPTPKEEPLVITGNSSMGFVLTQDGVESLKDYNEMRPNAPLIDHQDKSTQSK